MIDIKEAIPNMIWDSLFLYSERRIYYRIMLTAKAMSGFQNIIIRGLGLASVWTAVGVLSIYALFFFALAVWRFGKMEG